MVDISDALSEREKVKFTVHTRVIYKSISIFTGYIMKQFILDNTARIRQVRFFSCPATWRIYLVTWSLWREWSICWLHCKSIFIFNKIIVTYFFVYRSPHHHLGQTLTVHERSFKNLEKVRDRWQLRNSRKWSRNLKRNTKCYYECWTILIILLILGSTWLLSKRRSPCMKSSFVAWPITLSSEMIITLEYF